MTAYVKMVGNYVRAHFGANDAGQNMVETALIIGVISLVIVTAFLTSGVSAGIANLANEAACEIQGGNWTAGPAGTEIAFGTGCVTS